MDGKICKKCSIWRPNQNEWISHPLLVHCKMKIYLFKSKYSQIIVSNFMKLIDSCYCYTELTERGRERKREIYRERGREIERDKER